MEEGEPIEHKLVTRAIATAQKRVETHNFEIRKHLLEYDDVMNKQREVIYGMRRQILDGESQAHTIAEWLDEIVGPTLETYAAGGCASRGLGSGWAHGGAPPAVRRLRLARSSTRRSTSRRGARRARAGSRPARATPSGSGSSDPS